MNPKEHWKLITSKLDIPPCEKIFVVCRSRSVAERWAIHQQINLRKDFNYCTSIDTLKWFPKNSNIFVIYMVDDSIHWREDIERDRKNFVNLTVVVL